MPASSKPGSFRVASSSGSYDVFVAEGNFAETLSRIEDAHILCDEFFRPRFAGSAAEPVFIEAREHEKSLDRMPHFIEQMRMAGANRSTHLVAIGGGIIQDIAAFIASVYMRGIAWSYDPTTVLAMVDSCIGGKSSINVGPYKNLAGTFHPPNAVLIDPSLARTMPAEQFAGGLIEAAKICFCRGPEAFSAYLSYDPSPAMTTAALDCVIRESLHAKKHFIEIDEFDKRERLLLNFGHTFGHALEGASNYGIPHGIAVGLGILCSLAFQRQRGVDLARIASVGELERHLDGLIRTLDGLGGQLARLDLDDVLDRFGSDKKHSRTRFRLILVSANGEVVLEQIERTESLAASLRDAIASTLESYTR